MQLSVKEVPSGGRNTPLFRQVARESSGESFDVPEGNRLFFCYLREAGKQDALIGAATYLPAHPKVLEPGAEFLSNYYHILTYLFVKSRYKGQGVGSRILQVVERAMKQRSDRPVCLQSSEKAVTFFQRHGYKVQGDPIHCVCGGSPLFCVLYNMKKGSM